MCRGGGGGENHDDEGHVLKNTTSRGLCASVCCFVLLVPTPEEYRVPRVAPGVTASKLFSPLLPSLATPGPPLPYRQLQKDESGHEVSSKLQWITDLK